jgi:glycosyltransferase involved in cell wall biosynthesis
MWNYQKVSVVFPCYNEEEGILKAIHDFISTGYVDEVIVVDNNSTDSTAELVKSTTARLISEKRQGYGFTLRRGLAEASGDLIVLAEPDGTFVGNDICKLLAYASDFDMVLGARTRIEMVREGSNMDFFMRKGNWLVAKMMQFFFDTPPLSDCGCTMRLLKRTLAESMLPYFTVGKSHFLPEMVVLGRYLGASMIEIPLNYCARLGKSKITGSKRGRISVALNMVFLILKYRILLWFGWGPKTSSPNEIQ